jgi:hypothetical protein
MTEADVEKIIKSNMILQMNLAGIRAEFEEKLQRKPLTNGEIYTAYITATDQTLRPQDERLAFAFARAIEAAHGIKGEA